MILFEGNSLRAGKKALAGGVVHPRFLDARLEGRRPRGLTAWSGAQLLPGVLSSLDVSSGRVVEESSRLDRAHRQYRNHGTVLPPETALRLTGLEVAGLLWLQ
ncbi:MAG: hypothetical protein ACE5JI_00865 [Acidobacteriota bacterium]